MITYIYALTEGQSAIYFGITADPKSRLQKHRSSRTGRAIQMLILGYAGHQAHARYIESALIRKYAEHIDNTRIEPYRLPLEDAVTKYAIRWVASIDTEDGHLRITVDADIGDVHDEAACVEIIQYIPYNALVRVRRLGTEAEKVWLSLLWQSCVRRRKTDFTRDRGIRTTVKQVAIWSNLSNAAASRAIRVLVDSDVLIKEHEAGTPKRGPGTEFVFRLDFGETWNAFFYDPSVANPPRPSRNEHGGRTPRRWHYLKNVTLRQYDRMAKLGVAATTVWLAIRLGTDSGTDELKKDPYYHLTAGRDPIATTRSVADGHRKLAKYVKERAAAKAAKEAAAEQAKADLLRKTRVVGVPAPNRSPPRPS